MDLATEVVVKKENQEFDLEDDNKNLLDIRYDIKVEFGTEFDSYFEATDSKDWCIQNVFAEEKRLQNSVVSYDELLNYAILKCEPCCKTFTNRFQLLKHNLLHLAIKTQKISIFQCNECSSHFFLRIQLINHIRKIHFTPNNDLPVTKQMRECKLCCKVFKYVGWHAHMKEVHGERLYKCEICNYRFKAARFLHRHVIFKHKGIPRHQGVNQKIPDQDFFCNLCPAILKNQYALKTHVRNCHGDKDYKCDLCKIVFRSRPYLFCHLRRRHKMDEDDFECNLCRKQFKWLQMLKIHRNTYHGITE